jgi:3-oxoacyl-[acyl-carrier-protein] synthase II
MMARRVVVTGVGAVSPVGIGVETMWQNLIAGHSGTGPITLFDTTDFDVRIGGEVKGFDPRNYMEAKEARRMDRFVQFAVAALAEALPASGLKVTAENANDVATVIGVSVGGIWTYTNEFVVISKKGPRGASPFLIPSITIDCAPVQIALRTGAKGPSHTIATTCASGTDAIGNAYELIRRGHASAVFTGGFDAALTPIATAAFTRMRALSRRNDEPATASRPFDATRDGFVLAEGGAMLVVEDLEFALQRGAKPLAEVIGYAATSDSSHVAAPDQSGASQAHCLRLAFDRAGIEPAEVSYINAHGTSTPAGDAAEVWAIKHAFGEHASRIPISSTKSMTGHMIGGAGALEAAICINVIRHGVIPPTINLHTPDPSFGLDFVPNVARTQEVKIAASLSAGFGGHNAAIVLRQYP